MANAIKPNQNLYIYKEDLALNSQCLFEFVINKEPRL